MSVVEDVRQVLQDFIAPELRAITSRLDALDAKIGIRIDALEQRFEDHNAIMITRFDSLTRDIAQVKEFLEIDRRLARLEAKQSQVA